MTVEGDKRALRESESRPLSGDCPDARPDACSPDACSCQALDGLHERKRAFRAAVRVGRDAMPKGERAAADAAIAAQVVVHPAFQNADVVLSYLSFGSEVETRPILEAAWAAGKTVAIPRCAKRVLSLTPPPVSENASKRQMAQSDDAADASMDRRCESVSEIPVLEWYVVESLGDLVPGAFGILEPDPEHASLLDMDALGTRSLAVVPGLVFDRAGYRVGYGGGYYDRFLDGFPGISLGLCRSRFLRKDLRADGLVDSHDLPVDFVVTESGVAC